MTLPSSLLEFQPSLTSLQSSTGRSDVTITSLNICWEKSWDTKLTFFDWMAVCNMGCLLFSRSLVFVSVATLLKLHEIIFHESFRGHFTFLRIISASLWFLQRSNILVEKLKFSSMTSSYLSLYSTCERPRGRSKLLIYFMNLKLNINKALKK